MNTEQTNGQIPFIRELCRHKTEAEISEAEENFREFLSVIKEICDRLEREKDEAKCEIDGECADEIIEGEKLSEANPSIP